jgi:hypothetical protein
VPAWLRSIGWRATLVVFRPATVVLIGLVIGSLLPLTWLTSVPSLCPFKVLTGLPCPGCGLTRSSVAFLHGDPSTSVFYHPLGAPIIIVAVVIGLADAWAWWRSQRPGQPTLAPSWLLERLVRTPAPWVAIGALTVVWLVRLPLYLAGAWTF